MEPNNFCFWEAISDSLYLHPHHTQLWPKALQQKIQILLLFASFQIQHYHNSQDAVDLSVYFQEVREGWMARTHTKGTEMSLPSSVKSKLTT